MEDLRRWHAGGHALVQRRYLNSDGRRVDWKLIDVQTLDLLGDAVEDGREVYSELRDPSEEELRRWPARVRFDPENTPPQQTGV
ncbi:hypothetical protein GCM10022247_53420 [Allokutzneria multivorans]|uniref:Uncharacterized protein n=1 Tax=Allokutzneria multivorans TaxID=1142134 RepID=A0ABP7T887_9PSEU